MKPFAPIAAALALALILGIHPTCAAPIKTIVDGLGRTVELPQPSETPFVPTAFPPSQTHTPPTTSSTTQPASTPHILRTVSLAPVVSELMHSIGAFHNLVGISAYADTHGAKLPSIGTTYSPDWEKIAALSPDVAILPAIADKSVEKRLTQCKIKCVYLHPEGLKNIPRDIVLLGEIFNRQPQAYKLAADFDKLFPPIPAPHQQPVKRPRAVFIFGGISAGKNSYVSDILNSFGFENIADKIGKPWVILPREFVVRENPEAVFAAASSESEKAEILRALGRDKAWKNTSAVKNKKIFFIPYSEIILPNAGVLNAARRIINARKNFP